MAKYEDDGPNAVQELKWFLLIIVALFFVWVFNGGPQRMMQGQNATSTNQTTSK